MRHKHTDSIRPKSFSTIRRILSRIDQMSNLNQFTFILNLLFQLQSPPDTFLNSVQSNSTSTFSPHKNLFEKSISLELQIYKDLRSLSPQFCPKLNRFPVHISLSLLVLTIISIMALHTNLLILLV